MPLLDIKTLQSWDQEPLEVIPFEMVPSALSFQALTRTLYKDKIVAPIREVLANAVDVHKQINQDRSIEIKLPTALDSQFYIRDFGTGLSHDEVISLYTTLFSSSKSLTAGQTTGGFGIGAKSPFAYTDAFTIQSYHNGTMRIYTAVMDGMKPNVILAMELPTSEPNGLKIGYPIHKQDFEAVRKAVLQLSVFLEKPLHQIGVEKDVASISNVVKNEVLPGVYRLTEKEESTKKSAYDEGYGYRNRDEYETLQLRSGSIVYPVPLNQFKEAADIVNLLRLHDNLNNTQTKLSNWILEVPLGTLEPMLSRDGIQKNEHNKNVLKQITKNVEKLIFEKPELQEKLYRKYGMVDAMESMHNITEIGWGFLRGKYGSDRNPHDSRDGHIQHKLNIKKPISQMSSTIINAIVNIYKTPHLRHFEMRGPKGARPNDPNQLYEQLCRVFESSEHELARASDEADRMIHDDEINGEFDIKNDYRKSMFGSKNHHYGELKEFMYILQHALYQQRHEFQYTEPEILIFIRNADDLYKLSKIKHPAVAFTLKTPDPDLIQKANIAYGTIDEYSELLKKQTRSAKSFIHAPYRHQHYGQKTYESIKNRPGRSGNLELLNVNNEQAHSWKELLMLIDEQHDYSNGGMEYAWEEGKGLLISKSKMLTELIIRAHYAANQQTILGNNDNSDSMQKWINLIVQTTEPPNSSEYDLQSRSIKIEKDASDAEKCISLLMSLKVEPIIVATPVDTPVITSVPIPT